MKPEQLIQAAPSFQRASYSGSAGRTRPTRESRQANAGPPIAITVETGIEINAPQDNDSFLQHRWRHVAASW
jgi:hypothetical protein